MSHFALFNLEPRFALPIERLELAYRTLAAQVHPDRHAQSSSAARRESQMLAANANEAYRTLRKPLLRARHLLALGGVPCGDEQTSVSQAFLMEQMEWHEAIGHACAARDADALHRLSAVVRARAADLHAKLEAELDGAHDYIAAGESVRQLMFVEKLIAAVDEADAALED